MVRTQIAARGVKDKRVLGAMIKVKRHLFVPPGGQSEAYDDHPLSIGDGQTISQPYIVGLMSEALRLQPDARVLEIGTGSGYQAAILGELSKEVYSIEIVASLGQRASKLLAKLGYKNVHVRVGDGYKGWPEKAPFDAIMLTAAPHKVPEPLLRQLKVGGVLVAPVGAAGDQRLIRIKRTAKGMQQEHLLDVRFVPMTGKAQSN
jgi:protein-L-isoaspartate(D-aspartate) O-methyltransferase